MGSLPSKPDCCVTSHSHSHSLTLALWTLHGYRLNRIRIKLIVCRILWQSFHRELSGKRLYDGMDKGACESRLLTHGADLVTGYSRNWSHRSPCDLSKPLKVTRGVLIICQILSLKSPTPSVEIIQWSTSHIWVMRKLFWDAQILSIVNTEMLCIINTHQFFSSPYTSFLFSLFLIVLRYQIK